jgi:shikimate kinase
MTTKKIYITGFMGAGKSTVGGALAVSLGCGFIDLDVAIEQTDGHSIREMFDDPEKGQSYFRNLEHRTLRKLVGVGDLVISTGGGAFCQDRNRDFMLGDGTVVFLDTRFLAIRKRLEGDRTRPLFMERTEQELLALYDSRQRFYRRAHITVNGGKTVPAVVNDIIAQLGASASKIA